MPAGTFTQRRRHGLRHIPYVECDHELMIALSVAVSQIWFSMPEGWAHRELTADSGWAGQGRPANYASSPASSSACLVRVCDNAEHADCRLSFMPRLCHCAP
jgi:hypothetical protein